ncbi:hypothetical protein [Candidatus Binatus sp.]|uniref:hypothetical protein n=1 Tax=Candidatus Binatus sp. TaxID=2811406 RepID=UPI003C4DA3F2
MNGKHERAARPAPADLNSREAVEHFRKGAEEFMKKATRSKESAMKALVESGIYTKTGKLSKNYRS